MIKEYACVRAKEVKSYAKDNEKQCLSFLDDIDNYNLWIYTIDMCERAKTALDVVKSQSKKKTLTRGETIMLFEKVIEDNEKMGNRMTNIEKRMDSVEIKLDKVLTILDRPTIGKTLSSVFSNKLFIYIIVTLLTAAFGVGAGSVGIDLLK